MMQIEKIGYPDGSFYTKLLSTDNLQFRINSYEDLWQLAQIKDVLDNSKVNVDLTIPCLLDAQHDKRFNVNESFNVKLVCKYINNLKFRNVSIFHPHNAEVVEALIDNVKIITNEEFIRKVIYNELCPGPGFVDIDLLNNLILMSTDAGGFKPLMKLADKLEWKGETYSASKSRKYEDGKSKLIQLVDKQDFGGKDILIIDDLCVNGGTFIGLSQLLRTKNIGKIYLAVSHITVRNPNKELFAAFDKVFTTNSKFPEDNGYADLEHTSNPHNLQIIKMFE